MDSGGASTSTDVVGLLKILDDTDAALRTLYRQLAHDPDLAVAHEARLRELHATRLDLAQRVGLALLARSRAAAPSEPLIATSDAASTAVYEHAAAPVPQPDSAGDSVPLPPAPASDVQIAQWKSSVRATGLGARLTAAPSGGTAWPMILHGLMAALGPPRALDGSVSFIEEVEALDDASSDEHLARWASLPRSARQLWLAVLVARTRAVKQHPSASPEMRARVKSIIGRYPVWARDHAPGHVNGLQIKHEPLSGSWTQDALECWSAVGGLLGDDLPAHPAASPKKRTRREPDEEAGGDEPQIDPDWRLLPLVRGRKAVILGGDPREPNRQRLEGTFELASLEWPAIEGPRKVEAVVERIRRQAYGLVVVLTPFVFHKQSIPIIDAAKDAGVLWALAEGYGVASVRLGLERFLGGPRGEAGLPRDDDGQAGEA